MGGVFDPSVKQELDGTGFCMIILEAVLALSVSNSVSAIALEQSEPPSCRALVDSAILRRLHGHWRRRDYTRDRPGRDPSERLVLVHSEWR